MTQKLQDFLEKVAARPLNVDEIIKEAQEILKEEFKKRVLEVFSNINENYMNSQRQAILRNDKVEFIYNCYYSDRKRDFLNNNFGKLDKIMAILKEEIEANQETKKGEANE